MTKGHIYLLLGQMELQYKSQASGSMGEWEHRPSVFVCSLHSSASRVLSHQVLCCLCTQRILTPRMMHQGVLYPWPI